MSVVASALWDQARSRTGLNVSDGLLGDTNITGVITALNSGLADFATSAKWDWLYTEGTLSVVAGTTDYDVPTDHSSTVWIARGAVQLPQRQRKQAIAAYGMTGAPAAYNVAGGKIRLYPTPNVTEDYRHGYYLGYPRVTGANIAALSASLNVPQQFMSLAELFIARKICVLVNDSGRRKLVDDELQSELQNLRDDALRSSSPGVPETRKDTGF